MINDRSAPFIGLEAAEPLGAAIKQLGDGQMNAPTLITPVTPVAQR